MHGHNLLNAALTRVAVYSETIHFISISECTCMSIVQSYQGFIMRANFWSYMQFCKD